MTPTPPPQEPVKLTRGGKIVLVVAVLLIAAIPACNYLFKPSRYDLCIRRAIERGALTDAVEEGCRTLYR